MDEHSSEPLTGSRRVADDDGPGLTEDRTDVSEVRSTRHEMRELLGLLDATQRLAKVGGWEWDLRRQAITWTDETYRIHAMAPGDLPEGSPDHIARSLACYDPSDRPVVEAAFRRCVESGEPYDLELPFTAADGRRKWVQTTARPVLDGGRIVKVLGNIMDITERRLAAEERHRREGLERLVATVFSELVAARGSEIDPAVEQALARIGAYVGADRAYVFLFTDDLASMDNTHEWCAPGIEPQKDSLQGLPSATLPWWVARLEAHETIDIPAVAELPPEAQAEKEVLEPQGVQSLIVVPMLAGGELLGFLGFDAVVARRVWVDSERDLLQSLAATVVHAIQRRRAEDDLAESEERFRTLAENLPGVVYLCRNDSRYTMLYLNSAIESLTGYCSEEFLEDRISFVDLYSPEDGPRIVAAVEKALAAREPFHLVYRIRRRDGEYRWVEEWGTGVYLGEKLRFLEGFLADITERKHSEAELERSEREYRALYQQFRGILDAIPDAMCLVSRDLRIIWANEVAAANMGMTMSEFTGKHCFESRHGLVEACPDCIVLRAFDSGAAVAGEGRTPDGRAWELHALPVLGDDGEVSSVIEAARDITGRKQDEDERAKLQAQLAQAQKMESVGRLAGGVAHDFNNMLTVILGQTELALDRVGPGQPLFNELQSIRRAAERSAGLTRQLLAFARKQTVAPKVLDLNEVVEGTLKMLRRLIGEDIDLAWLPGGGLWPVKLDPSQVDQILANLCVNARDAIGDTGKVTIETDNVTLDDVYCSGHAGFFPGDFVVLAVSDDGCGMDAETLSRLFEPFFTTKEQGKGTGLGLATVYGIVKQNHGFVNVYSEPGRGSTFRVYLPRHTADTATAPRVEAAQDKPRGHGSILVVEDEPAILGLVKTMLVRQGYDVQTASSPEEAVRIGAACRGEIRLLLTDVVMPGMNGRELASRLRAFHPGIETLFMSGYTANVIAHHGVLDEGVHFIAKPFSSADLAAKVEEALRGRT